MSKPKANKSNYCVCGAKIEWVPVPPGVSKAFGPPYWRHTGAAKGPPHAAQPRK